MSEHLPDITAAFPFDSAEMSVRRTIEIVMPIVHMGSVYDYARRLGMRVESLSVDEKEGKAYALVTDVPAPYKHHT